MGEPVTINIELLDAMPEIQLIQVLMDASKSFDHLLDVDEKERAVKYFKNWYDQQEKIGSQLVNIQKCPLKELK